MRTTRMGSEEQAKTRAGRKHKMTIMQKGALGLILIFPLWVYLLAQYLHRVEQKQSDPCEAERVRMNQSTIDDSPARGTWELNPSVHDDPFFAGSAYPNPSRPEVANALYIAGLVREVLDIRDFEVYDNGQFIGLLPEYYMGFPKAGTTTAYAFMESSLCCMAKDLVKEPHFWYVHFNPHCKTVEHGVLSDCDRGLIKEIVSKYVHRSLESVQELKTSGKCERPYVVDGSTHQMFEPALETRGAARRVRDIGGDVPFDFAVFLHAITPNAKFIAVVRGNCPELLRSIFFFYQYGTTADKYGRMLQTAYETLQGMAARADKCEAILHARLFKQSLRAITFGSSCNMNKYVTLFGARNVFMTDVKAMTSCQDGFTRWMGSRAPCAPFTSVRNENKRSETPLPPHIDGLEELVLGQLDLVHYALLYAAEGTPCERYAAEFNHSVESVVELASREADAAAAAPDGGGRAGAAGGRRRPGRRRRPA